jgi:hypothetical protein
MNICVSYYENKSLQQLMTSGSETRFYEGNDQHTFQSDFIVFVNRKTDIKSDSSLSPSKKHDA